MVFQPAKHVMRIIMKETVKKLKRGQIRAEYGKDIFGTDAVLSRPSILGTKKATN